MMETILQSLRRLAAAEDSSSRRELLLHMLKKRNIPYRIQQEDGITNILAGNLDPYARPVMVCAHYDIVSQSSGANDNLSSVSILLHLLETGSQKILGVFLDGEETGHTGAHLFYRLQKEIPPGAILVLDTCGFGNIETYRIRQGRFHPLFRKLSSQTMKKKYHLRSLPCLMESDDGVLAKLNVPTMLISMLPEYDVQALQSAWNYYGCLLSSSASWPELVQSLEVWKTIHGGPLDNPKIIMEHSMENVLHHLQEVLSR